MESDYVVVSENKKSSKKEKKRERDTYRRLSTLPIFCLAGLVAGPLLLSLLHRHPGQLTRVVIVLVLPIQEPVLQHIQNHAKFARRPPSWSAAADLQMRNHLVEKLFHPQISRRENLAQRTVVLSDRRKQLEQRHESIRRPREIDRRQTRDRVVVERQHHFQRLVDRRQTRGQCVHMGGRRTIHLGLLSKCAPERWPEIIDIMVRVHRNFVHIDVQNMFGMFQQGWIQRQTI